MLETLSKRYKLILRNEAFGGVYFNQVNGRTVMVDQEAFLTFLKYLEKLNLNPKERKFVNFFFNHKTPQEINLKLKKSILCIISEILNFPSIFLLFLKRRIRLNELELIGTQDEIDIFMFFLKEGLYFESREWKDIKHLSLGNYCDSLDKYYLFKDGLIPEVEKPRFNIPLNFEKIVKKIESTKKKGFTIATTNLLDVDSKDIELFLELIERFKKKSVETGEDYKMFFKYKKEKKGIMFVIRTDLKKKSWE